MPLNCLEPNSIPMAIGASRQEACRRVMVRIEAEEEREGYAMRICGDDISARCMHDNRSSTTHKSTINKRMCMHVRGTTTPIGLGAGGRPVDRRRQAIASERRPAGRWAQRTAHITVTETQARIGDHPAAFKEARPGVGQRQTPPADRTPTPSEAVCECDGPMQVGSAPAICRHPATAANDRGPVHVRAQRLPFASSALSFPASESWYYDAYVTTDHRARRSMITS